MVARNGKHRMRMKKTPFFTYDGPFLGFHDPKILVWMIWNCCLYIDTAFFLKITIPAELFASPSVFGREVFISEHCSFSGIVDVSLCIR